jgi:hypothetical protein
MTDTDLQSKLAEYEDVVRLLTAKLEELAAENARLRSSENNAHSVLREVYNDPTASSAVRVKAAGLALPHEVPRLQPVPPPLDLVAEPIVPLAELVEQQRARMDRLLAEARDIEVSPSGAVRVLPKPGRNDGNGSDHS